MPTVIIPEYVVDTEVYEENSILFSNFTDGGSTSGTYTCKFQLPVNFWIDRCILTDVTGFSGDTSAACIIGDGSDTDRLNTGTPSVLTTATIINMGLPSGTLPVTTAFFPVITVTGAADFTSITAGAMTIKVYGRMVR
jgi:hypothetical protein